MKQQKKLQIKSNLNPLASDFEFIPMTNGLRKIEGHI